MAQPFDRKWDGVGTVWMRLRFDLRARWRAWLDLALVIGLGGRPRRPGRPRASRPRRHHVHVQGLLPPLLCLARVVQEEAEEPRVEFVDPLDDGRSLLVSQRSASNLPPLELRSPNYG